MEDNTILKVRNLTTSLRIRNATYQVVQDLSFDLKKGQTLALVGESGSGKSMTALSLMRILPEPPALAPTGTVEYQGKNLLVIPESEMRCIRGKKIAMIFQNPKAAFNPVYTIGEQLTEVAETHLHCTPKDAYNLAAQMLEDVHLPHPLAHMKEYPHQMSGGMLQRAMIAMALICSPDILIADEPTTALDVTIQSQILLLLKEIQQKKGMAVLLITHDMGVVAELADDVIVMYATEQIEHANVHAIFDNPLHPYTQALFASRPSQMLKKGALPTITGSVPALTEMPKGCVFHPRCSYTMSCCKGQKPPTFSSQAHETKCWLYDPELQNRIEHDAS